MACPAQGIEARDGGLPSEVPGGGSQEAAVAGPPAARAGGSPGLAMAGLLREAAGVLQPQAGPPHRARLPPPSPSTPGEAEERQGLIL